jgi:hypothetical protein
MFNPTVSGAAFVALVNARFTRNLRNRTTWHPAAQSNSKIASATACGVSCGGLWPIPGSTRR